MRRQRRVLQSTAAAAMQDFLDYHHALGKRFDNEAWALNLFDRYLVEQKVEALTAITSLMVEKFLSSRPRKVAKSFNHLLGVLRRWFDWLVVQERLGQSPLHLEPRRLTGVRPPFLFEPDQARALRVINTWRARSTRRRGRRT